MAHTTLILGAGLGKEYGFPDGKELNNLIASELPDHEHELRKILEWSTAETIDAVASRYPQHADKIRQLVIKILRDRENESALKGPNTYKLILEQVAAAQAKRDQVQIITFNYDRSLQYLLSMVNSVAPTERKIDPNIISTVYGRLAPLYFEDPNRFRPMAHHDYGPRNPPRHASQREYDPFDTEEDRQADHHRQEASDLADLCRDSRLFFIGEEKAPKPSTDFSKILQKSDQIFFLGVGYHTANMNILGFNFRIPHPDKIIAGTGLDLEPDHVKWLKREYPAITHIEDCKANTFLKTKFDISDPSRNLAQRSLSILDAL